MTFQTYNLNIPNPPNNPSIDVPNMQTNTNSIANLWLQDHFGFNDSLGGDHKQISMPVIAGGSIPSGRTVSEATLYPKTATVSNPSTSESEVFYTPDNSGKEYQLTRTITLSYALFGTNTNNYTGSDVNLTGGWTFLPGNILLQYGTVIAKNTDSIITFPVKFIAAPFSIQITVFQPTNTRLTVYVKTIAADSFTIASRDSGGSDVATSFFWQALGI